MTQIKHPSDFGFGQSHLCHKGGIVRSSPAHDRVKGAIAVLGPPWNMRKWSSGGTWVYAMKTIVSCPERMCLPSKDIKIVPIIETKLLYIF